MIYKNILITGGAGVVGSNLAVKLKEKYPQTEITALDNLKRRGSELNMKRLAAGGINFLYGDIRNPEDLESAGPVDLIIMCAAEAAVLAGVNSSPAYLLNTNLMGSLNTLELARRHKSAVIFISSSRVYDIEDLNKLECFESETRFELKEEQKVMGASAAGINENFPLGKSRSLYGTTKACVELLLQEYIAIYGIKGVIDRFGLITGPWQMGNYNQGVVMVWLLKHIFDMPVSFTGFGGTGKQVRDFIHIDDVFDIIDLQINNLDKFNQETFNIGGGREYSVSLYELTELCREITGKNVPIERPLENRALDIKIYLTDAAKIKTLTGWQPTRGTRQTLEDINKWIMEHKEYLRFLLNK